MVRRATRQRSRKMARKRENENNVNGHMTKHGSHQDPDPSPRKDGPFADPTRVCGRIQPATAALPGYMPGYHKSPQPAKHTAHTALTLRPGRKKPPRPAWPPAFRQAPQQSPPNKNKKENRRIRKAPRARHCPPLTCSSLHLRLRLKIVPRGGAAKYRKKAPRASPARDAQ